MGHHVALTRLLLLVPLTQRSDVATEDISGLRHERSPRFPVRDSSGGRAFLLIGLAV